MAAGRKFQAAGPQTAKLRDPYERDSRVRGIISTQSTNRRRHKQTVVANTGIGLHRSIRFMVLHGGDTRRTSFIQDILSPWEPMKVVTYRIARMTNSTPNALGIRVYPYHLTVILIMLPGKIRVDQVKSIKCFSSIKSSDISIVTIFNENIQQFVITQT